MRNLYHFINKKFNKYAFLNIFNYLPRVCLLFVFCSSQPLLRAQNSTDTLPNRMAAITNSLPPIVGMGYMGTLGFGGSFQTTTRLTNKAWGPDGSLILNLGLGNPEKGIGIDVRINIYGTTNSLGQLSNFGEGTLNLHLSRKLNENLWAGIGGYDLWGWEASLPNKLKSFYGALTFTSTLKEDNTYFFSQIYLTGGFGNGRFRRDADFTLSKSSPLGLFASIAIQVWREGNFVTEWSGYGLYSGFSFYPFKKLPIQMIVGYDDLLHSQRRLVVACSAGINIKKGGGNKRYLPPPPPPQMSRV